MGPGGAREGGAGSGLCRVARVSCCGGSRKVGPGSLQDFSVPMVLSQLRRGAVIADSRRKMPQAR